MCRVRKSKFSSTAMKSISRPDVGIVKNFTHNLLFINDEDQSRFTVSASCLRYPRPAIADERFREVNSFRNILCASLQPAFLGPRGEVTNRWTCHVMETKPGRPRRFGCLTQMDCWFEPIEGGKFNTSWPWAHKRKNEIQSMGCGRPTNLGRWLIPIIAWYWLDIWGSDPLVSFWNPSDSLRDLNSSIG
jgi:hypothetical protein